MTPEATMAWIIALPLVGAIICGLSAARWRASIGLASALATGLAVALLWLLTDQTIMVGQVLGGWPLPLGIGLTADGFSLIMLAMTAVVGLGISVYAVPYFHHEPDQGASFWPLWLIVWGGLNALFLSADLFNLYVTLELLGLSAIGLAARRGKGEALAAAIRYGLVALAGSLLYLLGVALVYSAYGVLDWRVLPSVLEGGFIPRAALALMTVGLLLKAAIFPCHFWLPPAHGHASGPVSALLSALVIKGAFYIIARLWLWTFPQVTHAEAYQILAGLGAVAILWGSVMALRQQRLKLLVAYSTVAQVGYFFLMFDLVLYPEAATQAWKGGVFMVISHGVAKAAMFMAAGIVLHAVGHDRLKDLTGIGISLKKTMLAFGLAGVSLMGLPPSGGFVGKWLLLGGAVAAGEWWLVAVLLVGGLLAAGYVFKVVSISLNTEAKPCPIVHPPHPAMEWSALILALLAVVLCVTAYAPLEQLLQAVPPPIAELGGVP